jgi:prolipoprotein diacylglyceryltransferase
MPDLATFPVYLHFGRYSIHPHLFFETLSYIVAFVVYFLLRRRFGDTVITPLRWAAIAAAVAGAAFGSKLLFWLEDPQLTLHSLHDPAYLLGGKTIVGALAGGLITVELVKRYIGIRTSTGDLYAIPLAIGIAIGRVGCFLTGLTDNTYGTPTHLPWAFDFGDGIPRHPTQLYEIVFLLLLVPVLLYVHKSFVVRSGASASSAPLDLNGDGQRETSEVQKQAPAFLPGDVFKLFMIAYMLFRFLCDFIKPYPRIFLGLGGIQWACVAILLYYVPDVVRMTRQSVGRE